MNAFIGIHFSVKNFNMLSAFFTKRFLYQTLLSFSLFFFFFSFSANSNAVTLKETNDEYVVSDIVVSYLYENDPDDSSKKNVGFLTAKRYAIRFIESKKKVKTNIYDEDIENYIYNYNIYSVTDNKLKGTCDVSYSITFDKIAIDNKIDYERIKNLNSKISGSESIKSEIKTSKNPSRWITLRNKLNKNAIKYRISHIDVNKVTIVFENIKSENLIHRLKDLEISFKIKDNVIYIN